MRRRVVRSFLLALVTLAVVAPMASAAPVTYVVSLGNSQTSTLTLDGDQLTGLHLSIFAESCAMPTSSPSAVGVGLPASPVSVSGGVLHVDADGVIDAYPGSSAHVAIDGSLSPDRRTLAGTFTVTALTTPNDTNCDAAPRPFIAIVEPATVPPDPEHVWTINEPRVQADVTGGHITRLKANAPLACGNAVNLVAFDTRAYGMTDIAVGADGSFGFTMNVLDEYRTVRVLTVSGSLSGAELTARFQVADTNVTTTFMSGCVGDATFGPAPPPAPGPAPAPGTTPTAKPTPPTGGHTTLPHKSGPSASFDWAELRINRGASYTYFIMVDRLACSGGATHVRVVANGRSHRLTCRHRRAFASGPLVPGINYRVTAQALRIRRGRIVKRGPSVVTLLHMRSADDTWVPIAKLPGRPPTV